MRNCNDIGPIKVEWSDLGTCNRLGEYGDVFVRIGDGGDAAIANNGWPDIYEEGVETF